MSGVSPKPESKVETSSSENASVTSTAYRDVADSGNTTTVLHPLSAAPAPRPLLQDGTKSAFTVFAGAPQRPAFFAQSVTLSGPPTTTASSFSSLSVGVSSSGISHPTVSKPVSRTNLAESSSTDAVTSSSHHTPNVPAITPASSSSGPGPMASIIRGPPHIQVPHGLTHPAIQATYSSHVPRGAAAVACITTLKSTVATPIPRTSHIYPTNLISGTIATHPTVQTRNTLPTLRSAPTPIPRTITPALSSISLTDVHRPPPITANTLSGAKLLITSPRGSSETTVRQTLIHSTGNLPKTQPFLPQLQQMPDKSFYRPNFMPMSTAQTPSPITTTLTTQMKPVLSLSHPLPTAHLVPHPQLLAHSNLSGTGIGSTPTASLITTNPPPQSHPHLPKVIAQTIHTVAPVAQLQPVGTIATSTRPATTTAVVVTHSLPRPIVSTGTSIPVAKVYPQSLTVTTRPVSDIVQPHEISRSVPATALFISPSQRSSPSVTMTATVAATVPGTVVTANIPAISSTGVAVTEAKLERSQVQAAAATYTIPTGATAYYYESYQGVSGPTLAMHPFPNAMGTHPFVSTCIPTSTIRSALSVHASNVRAPVSSSAAVTMSPMIVTVSSPRQTIALPSNGLTASTTTTTADSSVTTDSVTSTTVVTATSTLVVSSTTLPSSYTAFTGSPIHTGLGNSLSATPSSSPRPSILRKRTADGSAVRKNLLSSLPGSQPPSPHPDSSGSNATVSSSSSSSPKPNNGAKEACQDNMHSSEGADSCNGIRSLDVVVKQEPVDNYETNIASVPTSVGSSAVASIEASPRKKPRKQQLTGNELIELHSTEGEEEYYEKDSRETVKKEVVKEGDSGIRWVLNRKRPPVAMLNSYRYSWKSRHNHFMRYTDVKHKEERRPTVVDLANQKGVVQKANGWKMYHICSQIEDLVLTTELESTVHMRLSDLLENMEQKTSFMESDDLDFNRANELVRGNLQRCKIIRDQMRDARQQILKVLDHKSRIIDIVSQHISKHPSRKR